jgi:acyl carrier protein
VLYVTPMKTPSRQQVYDEILRVLREQNPEREITSVREDENLFDTGLVDSLRVIEVMVLVETLTGRKGEDLARVSPASFYTLRAIYDTFFQSCLAS